MANPARPPSLLAWGATVALILVGGLALYLARSALEPRLDALPDLAGPAAAEEPPVAAAPAPAEDEPEEEPSGPQLTYEQIEEMLAPLPARVLELVAQGREELPDFRDISSTDEAAASRSHRFFRTWAATWNNRIAALEKDTPPGAECEIHAALEPTCAMLAEAYAVLRTLPEITEIDQGTEILDRGGQIVEDFLNPPEEETVLDEDGVGEDEPAVDGVDEDEPAVDGEG